MSASVTAFHYHFRNRQLATVVDLGGAQINSTLNAGRQTSYGVDAEVVVVAAAQQAAVVGLRRARVGRRGDHGDVGTP